MFGPVKNDSLPNLLSFSDERGSRTASAINDFIRSLNDPGADFKSSCETFRRALAHMGPRDRFLDVFRDVKKERLLDAIVTLIIVSEGRAGGKSEQALIEVLPAAGSVVVDEQAGEALSYVFGKFLPQNLHPSVSINLHRHAYIAKDGSRDLTADGADGLAGLMRFADDVPVLGGLKVPYSFARTWQVPDVLQKQNIGRLKDFNLQGADLRGVNLKGVDLRGVNLQGADLRGVNLKGADLRGANLQGANLCGAKLYDTILEDACLQGANLSGVKLDATVLDGANLQDADLSKADLRDVDLRTTLLQGANLKGADMRGSNLRRVNLERACLTDSNLERASLAEANLQGVSLLNANLHSALLTDANLQRANLVGAKINDATNLRRADLKGCRFDDVGLLLDPADLSGAILQVHSAQAADVLSHVLRFLDPERYFDVIFNHRNNDDSCALMNISRLDHSCRAQTQALMKVLVGEFDALRVRNPGLVMDLVPSLGDVLFLDPEYLQGHDAFATWLLDRLMGNGTSLLDEHVDDATLKELGLHAVRLLIRSDLGEIAGRSVAIFQVLHEMRGRAQSDAWTQEERHGWRNQADRLHQKYCAVLREKLPSLMDEHGIYQSELAVRYDDDTFPLLSADGQACVMMTDAHYRQLVLEDDSGVASEGRYVWDDLRCVGVGADVTYPASVAGSDEGGTRGTASTASVLDQIPLLRSARTREGADERYRQILTLSGLHGAMLERFLDALRQRDTREKMIGVDAQLALSEIFMTKVEDRDEKGVHLAAAHLAELQMLWPDESRQARAFRLLCLSILYTNYASSHVFGTETESPNALRFYAEALLRTAQELTPGLVPDQEYDDWINRLSGKQGAFTCTSVLYGMQSRHVNELLVAEAAGNSHALRMIRDEMIPLAWR